MESISNIQVDGIKHPIGGHNFDGFWQNYKATICFRSDFSNEQPRQFDITYLIDSLGFDSDLSQCEIIGYISGFSYSTNGTGARMKVLVNDVEGNSYDIIVASTINTTNKMRKFSGYFRVPISVVNENVVIKLQNSFASAMEVTCEIVAIKKIGHNAAGVHQVNLKNTEYTLSGEQANHPWNWVDATITSPTSIKNGTPVSYSLNSYLPASGLYEICLTARIKTAAGALTSFRVYPENEKHMLIDFASCTSPDNNATSVEGASCIIPVNDSRTLILSAAEGTCNIERLVIKGYRKIGDNPEPPQVDTCQFILRGVDLADYLYAYSDTENISGGTKVTAASTKPDQENYKWNLDTSKRYAFKEPLDIVSDVIVDNVESINSTAISMGDSIFNKFFRVYADVASMIVSTKQPIDIGGGGNIDEW